VTPEDTSNEENKEPENGLNDDGADQEPKEEVLEPEKGVNIIKPKTNSGVTKKSADEVETFF
jgi:hypothetical protein